MQRGRLPTKDLRILLEAPDGRVAHVSRSLRNMGFHRPQPHGALTFFDLAPLGKAEQRYGKPYPNLVNRQELHD